MLSKRLKTNLGLFGWIVIQMYVQRFADQRERFVLYQSLWIINELKQKATEKILTATKLIKFTSGDVFKVQFEVNWTNFMADGIVSLSAH